LNQLWPPKQVYFQNSEWVQVLGDERLTSGLLDRLTFRCHILEFLGDSFRFRHGLERQMSASPAPSAPLLSEAEMDIAL